MRNRVLLGAVGAGVAVLALWLLLLWSPQGRELSDARGRRDGARDRNAQLELQLARLESAQDRAPELTARLEQLRVAVPEQPNLAQFILDANDAAERSGIDFISVSPTPPSEPEGGGPPFVSLSINISGGYFQVLDFVNRLEALPRVVVIDTLNLTPAGGGGGPVELSVAITARMFTTAVPGIPGGEAAQGADGAAGDGASTTTTTAPPDSGTGADGSTTTTTAPAATPAAVAAEGAE